MKKPETNVLLRWFGLAWTKFHKLKSYQSAGWLLHKTTALEFLENCYMDQTLSVTLSAFGSPLRGCALLWPLLMH